MLYYLDDSCSLPSNTCAEYFYVPLDFSYVTVTASLLIARDWLSCNALVDIAAPGETIYCRCQEYIGTINPENVGRQGLRVQANQSI